MVTIQLRGLQDLLAEGIRVAKQKSHPILVSHIKRIKPVNPLSFFDNASSGRRMYWTDPNHDMTFAGVGSAYVLKAEENVYNTIDEKWSRLIEHSIIDVEGPHYKGTGPILFGGFAFDPKRPTTEVWENFSNAEMILPQFLLTESEDATYLSINTIVSEEDDENNLVKNLSNIEEQLSLNTDVREKNRNARFETEELFVDEWKKSIEKVTEEINDDQYDKVVLARELRVFSKQHISPADVLFHLIEEQKYSYVFAYENDLEECFVGASPERLVKRSGNTFNTACLAGSVSRGETVRDDEALGRSLLNDKKNLHEHDLVVQMIKSAMENVCETVISPDKPTLFKLKHIQHLFTPVTAKADHNVPLLSVVQQLHPTPALGGYPKEMAIDKIREVENMDRGWYAAPIGWMDYKGDGEFAVAIRSGLLKGSEASLFAGCGIVGDSDPESEYIETQIKFKPMLSALGGSIT